MLNWIKFFPYCSRIDFSPKEIRGPYFPKPKQNDWYIGDNILKFEAPRSNPVFSLSNMGRVLNATHPKKRDILKHDWNKIYATANKNTPVCEWNRQLFYSNAWYFVGPWFTGSQARLGANGLLLTLEPNNRFEGGSLFHPRVFENAVAYDLDIGYGYHKTGNGRGPHFRGPLNWQVLSLSESIKGIVCDIHCIGNSSRDNPTLHRKVYFPISHNQLILLVLDFGGTSILEDEVRSKPLFSLCNSIINSLKLEVGKQTLSKWEEISEATSDMSIVDSFPELPWPLKLEKQSKKPKERDITPNREPIEVKKILS